MTARWTRAADSWEEAADDPPELFGETHLPGGVGRASGGRYRFGAGNERILVDEDALVPVEQ